MKFFDLIRKATDACFLKWEAEPIYSSDDPGGPFCNYRARQGDVGIRLFVVERPKRKESLWSRAKKAMRAFFSGEACLCPRFAFGMELTSAKDGNKVFTSDAGVIPGIMLRDEFGMTEVETLYLYVRNSINRRGVEGLLSQELSKALHSPA